MMRGHPWRGFFDFRTVLSGPRVLFGHCVHSSSFSLFVSGPIRKVALAPGLSESHFRRTHFRLP
uniref:Uncharacterized protein n=1 Tax=Candidatus Kentrum sp. SD TaxID=2126332 RepID=A0A450YEA8_9GAMM|nr:MAG: hypothetical protein BECKSD772F_GA0070984_104813 [Candidatus Kentron sp. SD]VFK45303.1 MAG: hypothetical protein BECKSD772E_GA0070983_105112 [Candidatus Kentron sp. SD]